MMKTDISFRLVAYTDAAGKYSPDEFRNGNEDNFYVNIDLSNHTRIATQDEIVSLGVRGMLMVVADGMGGMNAGEVASQIAVDSVKAAFHSELLNDDITASPLSRQKYLEEVIRKADKNIKSEAKKDRSREGMGSTIILAWLFNDELTISWCGDSRAYIFNEKTGIRLISQDHSYVQELVNQGKLTYDQTFDHPQNNIITRSLGDPAQEAVPESKTLKVSKGDIILLCSDGLSGVLRDRKTYDGDGRLLPEENMEDIIRSHMSSMKECREALWVSAERSGWYDNVTAILCQIVEGPENQWNSIPEMSSVGNSKNKNKKVGISLIIGVLIIIAVVAAFFIGRGSSDKMMVSPETNDAKVMENTDSLNLKVNDIPKETTPSEALKSESEGSSKDSAEKLNLTEQFKEQNKVEVNTDSDELTPIERKEETEKTTEENSELTPIE